MKLERKGRKVLLNGRPIHRSALKKLFRHHFSKTGWEKLLQDVEKYGRIHVAIVFVEKKKG